MAAVAALNGRGVGVEATISAVPHRRPFRRTSLLAPHLIAAPLVLLGAIFHFATAAALAASANAVVAVCASPPLAAGAAAVAKMQQPRPSPTLCSARS